MRSATRHFLTAANPLRLLVDTWSNRRLLGQFISREIEAKYHGSYIGILWSFITPLVMLAIYVFVFGVVFKARWPGSNGGSGGLGEFALVMFAGQIAFQLFGEPVGRAANLIIATPNLVRKVVFPLQILPLTAVGAAAFHAVVATFILLAASLAIHGSVPPTVLLAPLAALPLLMLGLGFTMLIASLGVYLRDVGFIVGVALQMLFFLTPIFYPASAVPEAYRGWLALNPLNPGVENLRSCLITGDLPTWQNWGASYLFGSVGLWLGHVWFTITRKGFADVV